MIFATFHPEKVDGELPLVLNSFETHIISFVIFCFCFIFFIPDIYTNSVKKINFRALKKDFGVEVVLNHSSKEIYF